MRKPWLVIVLIASCFVQGDHRLKACPTIIHQCGEEGDDDTCFRPPFCDDAYGDDCVEDPDPDENPDPPSSPTQGGGAGVTCDEFLSTICNDPCNPENCVDQYECSDGSILAVPE